MMKEKIKTELKNLMSDCTYTAETHYTIASKNKNVDFYSRLVPAVLTAILSVLEVYIQPESNLLISLILAAAVATAITNIIGAKEKYESHNAAGRKFTRLKKLCNKTLKLDAENPEEDKLHKSYELLLSKYLDTVDETPPTENWAFKKAQKRIQEDKVHEPD